MSGEECLSRHQHHHHHHHHSCATPGDRLCSITNSAPLNLGLYRLATVPLGHYRLMGKYNWMGLYTWVDALVRVDGKAKSKGEAIYYHFRILRPDGIQVCYYMRVATSFIFRVSNADLYQDLSCESIYIYSIHHTTSLHHITSIRLSSTSPVSCS